MAVKRFLTIYFMDGSNMSLTFPKQTENPHHLVEKVQKALDASKLSIEMDGQLFVVPMNNIKYLQLSPSPDKLPDNVIHGGALKIDY